MENLVDSGRRAFLLGRSQCPEPFRPPWAAEGFAGVCTGCDNCTDACPEKILKLGQDRLPRVDFAIGSGECTFCRRCVEVCPVTAFDLDAAVPWNQTAQIGEDCLAHHGVHCQSCGDVCTPSAIRFALRLGGPPVPEIDQVSCTGCGACLSTCPAKAIAMRRGVPAHV